MSDERIDSLVDRGKVKSDIDFVNELLSKVLKNISDINNVKINISNGGGMADVAKGAQAAATAADNLASSIKGVSTASTAINQTLSNVDQQFRAIAGSISENIKLQVQYESELKKVKNEIKEQNSSIGDTGTSFNKVSQKILDLKQREAELKAAISETNQTIKAQVKESQAAEGSYDAMSQELGQMRDVYRQLSAESRKGDFGQALKKNIQGLDTELKAIDAELGNFQRSVGNYKSGWNGLGNSINQITRELPAFTFSAQTGFLALSNNIPILADNIQQTAKEIKAMRAEGQQVPGLFKQIISGVFSFGTALSVAVTLITIFGKEIGDLFSELFKTKKPIDETKLAIEGLGEALKSNEYSDAVQKFKEIEITIGLAREGIIDKTKAVNEMNEKLGLAKGAVNNLDEAEKYLIDHKDAYLLMVKQKTLANIYFAKVAEENATLATADIQDNTSILDKIKKAVLSSGVTTALAEIENARAQAKATKQLKETAEERKKVYEKMAEDAFTQFKLIEDGLKIKPKGEDKKAAEDKIFKEGDAIRKANYEVQKRVLEDQITANEKIAKDDDESLGRRVEARKKYQAAIIALRKLEYNFQVEDITAKAAEDKKQAEREYKNVTERTKAVKYIEDAAKAQLREAEIKFNSDITKLRKGFDEDRLNNLRSTLKKYNDELAKHDIANNDIDAAKIKNGYDKANQLLDEQFATGLIKEDNYNKGKLRLELLYQTESLNQLIVFMQKRIEQQKQAAKESGSLEDYDKIKQLEEELAALRIKLEQKVSDYKKNKRKDDKKDLEKEIEELSANVNTASQIVGELSTVFTAHYEKEKNRLQEQIDLINKKKQAEIDAVNASVLSEQDKAAKIAIINATAQAKQEALELRQRKADQRKAKFEKSVAILQIIAETAVAVMKAAQEKNLAQAYLIAGLGAAKLAAVIATPIPQYRTGTDSHPGGLAVVGDGGKSELVVTPSGLSYSTPNKSTLVNLPRGSKVFPDINEAMESGRHLLFNKRPVQVFQQKESSKEVAAAIISEMTKLNHTMKNKKTTNINITHAGMAHNQRSVQGWIDWVNNNVQSRG